MESQGKTKKLSLGKEEGQVSILATDMEEEAKWSLIKVLKANGMGSVRLQSWK